MTQLNGYSPEFQRLQTFFISENKVLTVFDTMTNRITTFNELGELIATQSLPEVYNFRKLHDIMPIEANRLIANFLPDSSITGKPATFLHETDSSFVIKQSFMEGSLLKSKDREHFIDINTSIRGNMLIIQDKLYYSPAVYTNTLYSYHDVNRKWQKNNDLSGYIFFDKNYELISRDDPYFTIKASGINPYTARINAQNGGLVYLSKSNKIVQFVLLAQENTNKKKVAVNIYDPNSNEVLYGEFKTSVQPDSNQEAPVFITLWADIEDNLYIKDYSDNNTIIKKVRLKY